MRRNRNLVTWAGFAIVLLALATYIPVFAVFPVTRDFPWATYLLFLAGAALIAVGLRRAFREPERYRGKVSGSILAALSILLIAFFVSGVTYFSRLLPPAETALHPGGQAPPFVLADTAGRAVSSADLLKSHRGILLVFYRGYW